MTETQALKLLQAVLRQLQEDGVNDNFTMFETSYGDGPLPVGVKSMTLTDAANWLEKNIMKLELGS